MISKRFSIFVAMFLLMALALLVWGCGKGRSVKQTYRVEGEVVAVAANHKSVTIRHKEIKGYMPAMTMPFDVKRPGFLKYVAVGDLVEGVLSVTDTEAWLSGMRVVGKAPPTAAQDPAKARKIEHLLEPGENVPDLHLTNQDDRDIRMSDLLGKVVVVNFIYTRCPLPNYCPWQSRRIVELCKKLTDLNHASQLDDRVRFVSVSIDPTNDTPAVLKDYAKRYDADTNRWIFATGLPDDIASYSASFGCSFWDEKGVLTHNLVTAIIRRDGKLDHIYRGNDWAVEEFVKELHVVALQTYESAAQSASSEQ